MEPLTVNSSGLSPCGALRARGVCFGGCKDGSKLNREQPGACRSKSLDFNPGRSGYVPTSHQGAGVNSAASSHASRLAIFVCFFLFFFFSLSKSRVNFCLREKKNKRGKKKGKKTLTDSLNTSVASPSPWGVRKTAPAGFKARKMLQSAFKSIAQNSPGR